MPFAFFQARKAVIAMAHIGALPGSPLYEAKGGMNALIDGVVKDVENLQAAGVDAIMFGNENDRPYLLKATPESLAAMTAVVSAVKPLLKVPFGDIAAVKDAITEETAAILIEPVQGEGGLRPVPKEFMQELRRLCDEYGLLLILDEVQTGVGRTGRLFAHESAGVTPDIMAIAKGIGGGFPLGACLATNEAAAGMVAGTHGSTYGGNPLAMAVGNAVLDVVLEDGFLQHVRDVALVFRQGLAALKDRFPEVIEDIRGEGLMLGIKAKVPVADLLKAVRAENLLAVPAGDNVLRLLPPLVVTAEEAREGLARIERAAEKLTAAVKAA